MGLHQNGYRDNIGIFRFAGATVSNGAYPSTLPINTHLTGACRNISAGQGITDDKVGVPMGANHPGAWLIPQKAGALSSHNRARGEATATLSMAAGRNLAATSDGTTTAAASLQLVVSLTGTSDGVATATGNVQAALGMAGSASASAGATATIGALAWAYGTAAGTATATLTRYATGRLYGSITPFTELSPENLAANVWNALAASFNDPGTMGNKLNTASSGGVDYGALADAVRTELGIELDAILEVWQRHGLDIANPLTQTTTGITAGAIDLAITGDPDVSVTVTRQP